MPDEKERHVEDVELANEKFSVAASSSLEDETHAAKPVISPEEKKLVRKINLAFVPLLCFIIFIQYMDKTILNSAGIMGLYEDTHITQDQFSWLGSLFYVGYLAIQLPNQYFLQRLPVSKYLGGVLLVWGATVACTALAKDFAQLAALRFLLGFFEGTTYPAIFLLIGTFYRRHEQVIFFGIMFICNSLTGIMGGAIALGIQQLAGVHGLSAWKWGMIIWGVITSGLGLFYILFLPDRADSRWFRLTSEEKQLVEQRTLDNAVIQNKDIKIAHVYEALKEPRLYCYFLISLLLDLPNGGTTIFSSQIIKQMGFSTNMSLILAIPQGATVTILIIISTYLSKRHNEIGYYGFLMSIVSLIGCLLVEVIPYGGAKMAGVLLFATSPPFVLMQTSISNNVCGYTKKIFYTSTSLVAYCIGNFVGPLMLTSQQAPRYIGGLTGYVVVCFVAGLLFLYLRWTYIRENKRRAQLKLEGKIPPPPKNRDELDLTDKEDLNFVYRP